MKIKLFLIFVVVFGLPAFSQTPYYVESHPLVSLPAVRNEITGDSVQVPQSLASQIIRNGSVVVVSNGTRWNIFIDNTRLNKKNKKPPAKPPAKPPSTRRSGEARSLRHTSVTFADFTERFRPLDGEQHQQFFQIAAALEEEMASFSDVLIDQFSMCSVDEAVARDNGTFLKLNEPYQVVLGRFRAVRAHASLLAEAAKTERENEMVNLALQLNTMLLKTRKSMEQVSRLTRTPNAESVQQWQFRLHAALEGLLGEAQIARRTSIWQLIAVDLRQWLQSADGLQRKLSGRVAHSVKGTKERLASVEAQLGPTPWHLPEEIQNDLAQQILNSVKKVGNSYDDLSEGAEICLGKSEDFDLFVHLLGANDNLWFLASDSLFGRG